MLEPHEAQAVAWMSLALVVGVWFVAHVLAELWIATRSRP